MATKNYKKIKKNRLKIKRAALFLLSLSLLFISGQNRFLSARTEKLKPKVEGLAITATPAPYPIKTDNISLPYVSAKSAVVLDRDSAVPLFSRNERVKLLPASTSKIMTALVVLDYYDLNKIITVGGLQATGQTIKLEEGEMMTVKNLLAALIISSANDAAEALAENYPGGEEGFIRAMNEKAKKLNLSDSYFANPTGLDSDQNGAPLASRSTTTALDLARLAAEAMKNDVLKNIVSVSQLDIQNVDGTIVHRLYNVNELLGKLEGLKGIKTGWTEEAGECLVGYTERNGHGIISVILGSQDRFGDTTRLTDWAFSAHRWEAISPSI